jgi:hypothetical protein
VKAGARACDGVTNVRMPDKARKLHVTIHTPTGPSGVNVRVQVCRIDQAERRSELLSSSDGVVAMEVRRPGAERRAFWRVVDTHELVAGDIVAQPGAELAVRQRTTTAAARLAFYALGMPDVYAIHVVDGAGFEATYLRDDAIWIDVPRRPHPLYRERPERS